MEHSVPGILDRYRQVENHGLFDATLSLNQMMAMSETLFANGTDLSCQPALTHGIPLPPPKEEAANPKKP